MYSNANGAALGPCTPAQLDVLWQSGHIGAATSFWKEGMAAWAALDALPALGARLRALEARWIASGFTLRREDLL